MVKVQVGDKEFYMDGYLKDNLDAAKEAILKDLDIIAAIDGAEGSGKSVFAQQLALYCCPTFNIDNIAFNSQQFKEKVMKAKKYEAIIYDESYGGLSAAGTTSRINRSLVKMLTEIRSRNLFIFILMPTFFDLTRYAAIWRTRVLIHVYFGEKFSRGYFSFFNSEKKQNLYLLGKKMYNYNANGIKPNFRGRTTNFWVVDREEYEKRKQEAIKDNEEETNRSPKLIGAEMKRSILRNLKEPALRLTTKQIAKIIGLTGKTIYNYTFKDRQEQEEYLDAELAKLEE